MTTSIASNPISDFLGNLHLGPRQSHKSLALWPVCRAQGAPAPDGTRYVSLGQALAQGSLRVKEVGWGGSVPNVQVRNKGALAVLFLFGEEIVGAKQNRVTNASFLVPAESKVVLDVSCVEAGRWASSAEPLFRHSDHVLSHGIRRRMASKVARSRASGGGFAADQREVWRGIGQRLHMSQTESVSAAYSDYRESRATDLEALVREFEPLEDQVGFVACIGDEVAGVELIGRPEVFRADFKALLRSYAIDAVDAAIARKLERPAVHRFDAPEPFLAAVAAEPFSPSASLGAGDDLRLRGSVVSGCALVHQELIHLTAFPA